MLASGPRAAEEALLGALVALEAEGRADPELLARPVRVVVPSSSLREHVAARFVARCGHPVAGFMFQTLHGLALESLDRAGEPPRRADALFPVLVRRAAREQPQLRELLDALDDGYGAVAAAVADLLDAGFDPSIPAHLDAMEQALAEAGLSGSAHGCASAVVAAAAGTAGALAELGIGRPGARLARAAELLGERPALLSARGIWVHGFADATGAASELLAALVAHCGARAIVDLPPDPARPERNDLGAVFADRLVSRLGVATTGPVQRAGRGEPELRSLRAAGTEAEVRGVADRIHAALEAGAIPEEIAVVARQLAPYAVSLRTHFTRLGIPFSARGQLGPAGGRARRIHALFDLLAGRDAAPADRWLDTLPRLSPGVRADLRLGFRALGAARLGQVAGLDPAEYVGEGPGSYALPARVGLAVDAQRGDGEVGARVLRRRLSGRRLRAAVARAGRAHRRLLGWPATAPLSRHLDELRDLAVGDLGWRAGFERDALEAAVAGLAAQLPDLPLSFDEFSMLVRTALRDAGAETLGGAGGGVRVLSVVEARGQTFDQLFVLGVNRDVFPRPVLEDPLLPDAVRRPLEAVLPEIPVKARGHEEERYLFAQLTAAARVVTLSWQVAGDDARTRAPSPFLERLSGSEVALPVAEVPGLQAPPERSADRPQTAWEAALAEGLYGAPARFRELLQLAAAERPDSGVAPGDVAAGRVAVLAETANAPGSMELGPYFGFVGPQRLASDVRANPVYVTHVERLAGCPWQYFVERVLGIAPPPDALDALPEIGSRVVGEVVHGVLEAVVKAALPEGARSLDAAPGAVPWPASEVLETLLHQAADECVRSGVLGPPSLSRVIVELARPLVNAARRYDWPDGANDRVCIGAELEAAVEVATADGSSRPVRFRTDRADSCADGLRLIDYKAGRVQQQKKLGGAIERGERLQAAAYAGATGGEGRYLYLAAEADESAVVSVTAADRELLGLFAETVGVALSALDAGSFFPRLPDAEDSNGARDCGRCEVREACLHGDAGARDRIWRWAKADAGKEGAERAAHALWALRGKSS